jgi:VWFA-related protein
MRARKVPRRKAGATIGAGAVVAAVLCSFAPAGRAATAPASPAPDPTVRFEDSTEVFSVEIPVTVVGRDGRPLRELRRDQFTVLDDGREQTISDFRVVDLADARFVQRADGSAPEVQLRSSERRHFLFLFDLSFATPTAILKARLAARDFVLARLHPSDLAAVATVSLEQGARLVVTFTPDRAQLARGIDTLGIRVPGEIAAGSIDPLRFMLAAPVSSGASPPASIGAGDPRSEREALVIDYLTAIGQQIDRTQKLYDRGRITSMTRTLGQLATNLARVQGRKHVVLFSEGFDSRLLLGRESGTAEEAQDQAEIEAGRVWTVDNDNRYGSTELQGAMGRMVDDFRAADCVIEAVDIGGLRAPSDATESGQRGGRDALFVMANGTGGTLFEGANDLSNQLDRLLERTSVTYVLAFERNDVKSDGSRHRVQVKVSGLPAGARVAHRAAYFAPVPFKDLHPLEKGLLTSDEIASAAPRRELDLALMSMPFRRGGNPAYVPVVIEIDGKTLPRSANGRLELELYGYVSDEQGAMQDFFARVVNVDLSKAQDALRNGGGIKYYAHFDLKSGRYLVRILVRDATSGRTGVQSASLDVPLESSRAPLLLPPLFFEEPGRWLLVREPADAAGAEVVYPFVLEGEPFVPAVRPRLTAGTAVELAVFAYRWGGGEGSFDAVVRDAKGATVRAGSLLVLQHLPATNEGVDKFVAEFDTTGLVAGDYSLEVRSAGPPDRPGTVASPIVSFTVVPDTGGAS